MKNATVLILFAVLFLAGLNSCKNGGGKQKTLNGFEVTFLDDQKGDLAKEGDYVYFKYYVMYKDSLIFSSLMQTPMVKFKLPKLEKGDIKKAQPIAEVLHMMSKGDSVIVYQKIDEQMKKSINLPHVDVLDFHVKLVDVKNEADYKAEMAVEQKEQEEKAKVLTAQAGEIADKAKKNLEDYKSGKLKSSLITTPSGLKYIVLEAGTGPKAVVGKPVSVNYYGMLMNGTRFDDSWSRGQEFSFPLGQGQVIKGWDEGVANLNEGAKACLFIPAELGYGAQGSPPAIPENAELMFYIEVNKVN
jgi:FKBP-type peptidyl-prolyl cis-trans isomerase FkpA